MYDLMDYDEVLEKFEPVMGMEVHVELNTETKMFSTAPSTPLEFTTGSAPGRPKETGSTLELGAALKFVGDVENLLVSVLSST